MTLQARVREHINSTLLIVGLFVAWEVACLVFHVSPIVLPRPSQIITTLVVQMPALWPNILQTLFTTMVGFAAGMTIGVLLGVFVGVSRTAYSTAYPLLVGFSSIPKVGRANLCVVVRIGDGPGHPHGDDNLSVSDRRQRGDGPCDDRAGDGGRAEGAGR
jgi:ABC-type nitrate/sulfonate/bicarbonate transport system permease component